MPFDRFLIAPFQTGLQTNLRPWLIMDDAFAKLNNAYVFRGRVRKRPGGRLMGSGWPNVQMAPQFSRLRIDLGPTVAGALAGTVPGSAPWSIGVQFSIGSEIYTVFNPAAGAQTMLDTGATATKTFDISNGNFNFAGAPVGDVFFYPSLPVMGIAIYEKGALNNQPTYAFDTQFAYLFSNGSWSRSGLAIWHGNDLNFFWIENYQGLTSDITAMYVTNFNATVPAPAATDDPIWYTQDGSNWTAATGANAFYFLPNGGAPQTGPYVKTSRIIVGYKDRLVLLNTVENDNSGGAGVNRAYVNRARFSALGSPLVVNAWYEPNQVDSAGNVAIGGGFEDAPTKEAIVSAEFIKDTLVVFFERSTWQLADTGNDAAPFRWQRINTELGSEGEKSTIPFDKFILTMGNVGVHQCNGQNVERIDEKIPDTVFEIQDKNLGVQRVAGIRDYFTELALWSFPTDDENALEKFPNRILIYNYRNDSWAEADDCITAFGYFNQQPYLTWQNNLNTWSTANFTWASGSVQAQFRQVIAGNQQGYVFIVDAEESRNAPVMSITNMVLNTPVTGRVTLTVMNHTLEEDEYIAIENTSGINLPILTIYQVYSVVDANTITIVAPDITGTYTGGGTITRVSNINFLSKQWNPYVEKDRNVYVQRIDFGVLSTAAGQITVDYFPSSTALSMLYEGAQTGALMGTGVLETSPYLSVPLEQQQTRLWHPLYFQSDGECIQLSFYFSDAQIRNPAIAWDDFELEGLILYCQSTTYRMQ